MIRRFLLPTSIVFFATIVLLVSLFNASEISFNVPDLISPLPAGPNLAEQYFVDYDLPEASSTPIPVLNRLKAAGDRVKMLISTSNISKAEIMLESANRRMVLGERYIRDGKIEMGLVTINKGQEYLENALDLVVKDSSYHSTASIKEIGTASLKHRERLESLMVLIPDEARTFLVSNVDRTKNVYNSSKAALISYGLTPPHSPFEGN